MRVAQDLCGLQKSQPAPSNEGELSQATQGMTEPSDASATDDGLITMVRPDMGDLPCAEFPEGFSIRPMRLDEVGLWTDIHRDAEPYFPIEDDLFYQEYGDDLQATQQRCFIIANAKGVAVGTISAWYNRDFKGKDYGRVHWVAVRPAYQRRGLARAGLAHALHQLAQWHDRCYLRTSIPRVGAIRLYLDAGFRPDLEPVEAIDKWRQVDLSHPGLEGIWS